MLDDVGRHLGNRDPDLHADRSRHRIVERPKCFERSVELIKGLRTDDYLKLHLRPALRHGHRRPNRFGSSARHILQQQLPARWVNRSIVGRGERGGPRSDL